MTRLLTEQEFRSTFTAKMLDVTETAEALVDIWPYVSQLTREKVINQYVFDNRLVEKVYRNQAGNYEHVLLATSNKNTFIVILVDLDIENVKGHYPLDLNQEYGLANPGEPAKLLPDVLFRLFKELWSASGEGLHPIENISTRLTEVAKSTGQPKDYVRKHLNELLKTGHLEMSFETPLLFRITEKGKKIKCVEDVQKLCEDARP